MGGLATLPASCATASFAATLGFDNKIAQVVEGRISRCDEGKPKPKNLCAEADNVAGTMQAALQI
jgi:hypothetical protein